MFSGIVEEVGKVVSKEFIGTNVRFGIQCSFTPELKIDQSIAHHGACLTVVDIRGTVYFVDVISESRQKTNLDSLEVGFPVNLERSMRLNERLDGHLVQGHVDQRAVVSRITNQKGSWEFVFQFEGKPQHPLVMKGSITINGVSLTISNLDELQFAVSIIPYTFEHTTFSTLNIGDAVNIEFDVIGKYVERLMAR